MKFKFMLIGIALALMLCISPVAAVSGNDFEIYISQTYPTHGHGTYKYWNLNNKSEIYTFITTGYTIITDSLVTFKPANIPDAPVMEVDTYMNTGEIFLPRSVDEWEIEYYSRFWHEPNICGEHLKCSGVVNLNEYFGKYIEKGLYLSVSHNQSFSSVSRPLRYWAIPDVD